MNPSDPLPYAIRQFEIDVLVPIDLFGMNMSFTTSAQAMLTTVALVTIYLIYGIRQRALVPTRLQASVELIYSFVARTVTDIAGPEARRAIPFVFTLFVYILFGSLIGLTPVKFTFTSHLIVTLALSVLVFGYATWLALRTQGATWFRHFLPAGTPLWLAPLLVLVEVMSYLFRPITLGVRVFANILAGHMMIKLFADFCTMIVDALHAPGLLLAVLPVALMVVLYGFEVLVFFVQSYIFILLTSVYLRESLHGH